MVTTTFVFMRYLESTYRQAAREVCELVQKNYYRGGEEGARHFVQRCRAEADTDPVLYNRSEIVARLNAKLSALETSHLNVFSPVEDRTIWENEGFDTGIRSRMIDGFLVVYKVLPDSPAARVGLAGGDVLLYLNDQLVSSSYVAQSGSGVFRIARGEREMEFEIVPEKLIEDFSPLLEPVSDTTAVLRIGSFLAKYFEDPGWRALASRLRMYQHVVIDLRDNVGGSFPGMLRALSPFRCDRPLVGQLFRAPSMSDTMPEAELENDLNAEAQLKLLKLAPIVNLKTFAGYDCYRGDVTVLIDSGTASVAEIFAHSFHGRPRSRVWGQPSSGQVVMAQWFTIPSLGGEGYSISIPIAGYRAVDGTELENQGLRPEKTLYYALEAALLGQDNWVSEAAKHRSFSVSK